jgi:hypothetical protein
MELKLSNTGLFTVVSKHSVFAKGIDDANQISCSKRRAHNGFIPLAAIIAEISIKTRPGP